MRSKHQPFDTKKRSVHDLNLTFVAAFHSDTDQEMMRDFENQEQQDGDEDEADQVRLGLSRGFFLYISSGKGQAAESKMQHFASNFKR